MFLQIVIIVLGIEMSYARYNKTKKKLVNIQLDAQRLVWVCRIARCALVLRTRAHRAIRHTQTRRRTSSCMFTRSFLCYYRNMPNVMLLYIQVHSGGENGLN